jgi:tetratricopeptide (TPR) repeat protein
MAPNEDAFDRAKIEELGPAGMMHALAPRVQCPEFPDSTPAQRRALIAGLEILTQAEAILGAQEELGVLRSMMLGKLGQYAAAVANARDLHAREPTWRSAVALANALRRAGDTDGSIDAFRAAAAIDPEDVTALLDIGDTLLGAERWAEAQVAYEEALAREADHAWATPSAVYARHRASGDAGALAELRRMASGEKDECGVGPLLAQMMGGYSDDDKLERARALLAEIEPPEAEPEIEPRKAPVLKLVPMPKTKAKAKAKKPAAKAKKPAAKAKAKAKPAAKAKKPAAKKPAAKKPAAKPRRRR